MTVQDLLAQIDEAGIALAPGYGDRVSFTGDVRDPLDKRGAVLTTVEYVAPAGALTPERRRRLVRAKEQLLLLLAARAQPVTVAPRPEPSVFRRWVTGKTPTTYQLPPPKYTTTRHEPVTYVGEACTTKACQKQQGPTEGSLRFFPSGLCVACWERLDKRTTADEAE
jgi:hypothetical protein